LHPSLALVSVTAARDASAQLQIALTGGPNAVVSAITFDPIPEPSTSALAALALLSFAAIPLQRRWASKRVRASG
jgi:hypothetical protein